MDRVFVTAASSDGSREDVTDRAKLTVKGPAVRIGGGNVIEALAVGKAPLSVSFGGRTSVLPVTVSPQRESARVSFKYEVLPVISKAGCNQGSCHGNGEGRGGLKLSLKAEDPDWDYGVIAHQGGGRRLDRVDPARSLLLLKATSSVPHGGGRRFAADSEEYRTLAAWISEGAVQDSPDAPRLVKLDISPREAILSEPAKMQRLTVLGRFSDGSVRNLGRRAIYNAGDPLVQVTEDGNVLFDRSADLAVMVRYADQMESARITYVPARKGYVAKAVPANNWIDAINFRRLKQLRLQPSELTTDSEFVRRAYLDAIGGLPKPDEVRAFMADARPDRRARLIDALLERSEFDDFWAMKWADVLRIEVRSLDPKGGAGYREWIRTSIAQRKPLDQFAHELLTATGSTYENPPANYYRRTRTAIELGENTAQVFMGVRMLCAKCHNHPFERWKQDDYYSLAAFFARVERKGELTRDDKFDLHELKGEETIAISPAGEVNSPRTDKPVPAHIYAPGVAGSDIRPAADVSDRRTAFADWLTRPDNPFFARSLANRIWYYVTGRGIVDPVDDLRESNPPANPELLDALTKDLVAHKFDLRSLVRTIMNSRTYQLSSTPNDTNADDDRFFSRGVPQRLEAEVLLDAISQATETVEDFKGYPAGTRAINLIPVKQRHPFLKLFGQPQRESVCECERTGETTLGQSFALISGELMNVKLKRPENRVGRLLGEGKPDGEIVSELYLATVSREPSSTEQDAMVRYVKSKPDRRTGFEDALWALINSKEFLLRR